MKNSETITGVTDAAEHHTDEGVQTTRRALVRGGIALPVFGLLAGWAHAGSRRADASGRRIDDLDVAAFIDEWVERAAELVAEEFPNEDASVHEICAGLARLNPESFPPRSRIVYQKNGLTTGPVAGDAIFSVLQIDLEPGAVIRPHNHVGWNFVSLGVKGDAVAQHFEPVEGAPKPDELDIEFPLLEVSRHALRSGRTSSLTRTRGNIHTFRAGEKGATMLDFGIHFPDPGEGPKSFSVLEIDPEPHDAERGVFNAVWIGNPYTK